MRSRLAVFGDDGSDGGGDAVRVNNRDAFARRVAREVASIEGQQVRQLVCFHGRHKSGVVGFLAAYAVGRHQSSPLDANLGSVVAHRVVALPHGKRALDLCWCQSQPAACRAWSCSHAPRFVKRLRDGHKVNAAPEQFTHSIAGRVVVRVLQFDQAQQDVRVKQICRW